jgi:hypothetical protein
MDLHHNFKRFQSCGIHIVRGSGTRARSACIPCEGAQRFKLNYGPKCWTEPWPATMSSAALLEPRISGVELALAYSANSTSVLTGTLGGTTKHCVLPPIVAIGENSMSDLYAATLLRCGYPALNASANSNV